MEKKLNMVFAGLLVLSCSVILHGFMTMPKESAKQNRYEMIKLTENNIAIIDHENDKIYYKFFASNEGPTNWKLLELPE